MTRRVNPSARAINPGGNAVTGTGPSSRPVQWHWLCTCASGMVVALTMLLTAAAYGASPETPEALRRQLAEQRAVIEAQQAQLDAQQKTLETQARLLDALGARLDSLEREAVPAHVVAAQPSPESATAPSSVVQDLHEARDEVGDLNAPAIRAGTFPGSFRLPSDSRVSLALGGFVKLGAIWDSDAEDMGAAFLPATLGSRRQDDSGAFSIDSTLSRFEMDGRATVPLGTLRGYLEWDFNGSNNGALSTNMRHAYGSWESERGTLLAGQTWSTFMDLGIVPEGLTEPTVSGVIFSRPSQIRWTQFLTPALSYELAIEDPSSNDVDSSEAAARVTDRPDAIIGLVYRPERWHVALKGIARNVELDAGDAGSDSATGWGAALTGSLNLLDADKLAFSAIRGQGLGRYLLGVQSNAAGVFNPATGSIDLRDNQGLMVSYRHQWNSALRSTLMGGFAEAESEHWQPGDVFERSRYGSINLMWAAQPYLTLGVEYGYGENELNNGVTNSNHRIAVGVQFF